MTGTGAMSGSAAMRLRNADHRRLGVEHALVHVDVEDLGPARHLLARDRHRLLVVARPGSAWQKRGEPVTFVRSPTLTKFVSGRRVSASQPERRV